MIAKIGNLVLLGLGLLAAMLLGVLTVQWPFGWADAYGVAEATNFWFYEVLLSPIVGYLALALVVPLVIKEFVLKRLTIKLRINAWFFGVALAFVILANLVIGEAFA